MLREIIGCFGAGKAQSDKFADLLQVAELTEHDGNPDHVLGRDLRKYSSNLGSATQRSEVSTQRPTRRRGGLSDVFLPFFPGLIATPAILRKAAQVGSSVQDRVQICACRHPAEVSVEPQVAPA
jgi:hypothetical protein